MAYVSRHPYHHAPSKRGSDHDQPKARRWYRRIYPDHELDRTPPAPARCGQPHTATSTPVDVALARKELEQARADVQQARRRHRAGEDGAAEVHAAEARVETARRAVQRAEGAPHPSDPREST